MIASLKKSSAKEEAEGGASVLFPQINPLILIAEGDRHSMCSEIAVDLLTDCREGEIAPERKRESRLPDALLHLPLLLLLHLLLFLLLHHLLFLLLHHLHPNNTQTSPLHMLFRKNETKDLDESD